LSTQPALQRVFSGEGARANLTADLADVLPEELLGAMLNVLDRQGRHVEYLRLAAATGQVQRCALMLIRLERVAEALDSALKHLSHASGGARLGKTAAVMGGVGQSGGRESRADGYNADARPTMAVLLTRRRFTVDDYHGMALAGILGEDDRVELIDGEIVEMAPIGPGHAATVGRCTERFGRRFADLAHVWVQNPIHLDAHNEPQPDLVLLRRRPDFYASALPTPPDVLLVVEVADTTLGIDRRVKLPLYARAGIPEAWLVDLQHRVLHVHREPTADGYRVTRTARRRERLAPLAFPDREIAVTDLLG